MAFVFNIFTSTLDIVDNGILSVAPVGSTPNSAGADITGTVLTLEPADATHPGVITTGVQTFSSTKTIINDGTDAAPGNEQLVVFSNGSDGITNAVSGISFASLDSGGVTQVNGGIYSSWYGSASLPIVAGMTFISPRDINSGTAGGVSPVNWGFRFDKHDGTTVMFVDTSTSSVGIGNTAPIEKLDVSGNIHLSGSLVDGSSVQSIDANNRVLHDNSGNSSIDWSGTNAAMVSGVAGDKVQLLVQGNGTQTSDIFDVLKSDTTVLFKVENSGDATASGNIAATNFSGSSSGTNTGDVTLGTFGSSPDAKGASISSQVLTLQPADATHPGEVSVITQSFGGGKTIVGNADEVQFIVKGNGTQTGNILEVRNSSNTLEVGISKTGQIQANEIFAFGAGDIVLSTYKMYNGSGSYAIDWSNDLLSDNSQVVSVDWKNRLLKNSLGNTTIDFSGTNPTLTAPALGTPISGVATNLTGTASGLTAGTATNATNVATTATNSTNASFFPTFVASSSSSNQGIDTATGLSFNPSTNTLTTTTFNGALTGSASGNLLKSTGDIDQTSFSASNNISSAADVTGLLFSNASVRAFEALVSVYVNAGTPLYETIKIYGIQKAASWNISQVGVGDSSGFVFTITSLGQVQYTNSNYASFTSAAVKFRATTLAV